MLYVLRITHHASHSSFYPIFVSLLILLSVWRCDQIHAEETPEPIQLEEITVTPGKFTIQGGTGARLSLSKKEINLFPLIDNDVARAAQIFPGVTSNDFSARFNLRGGEKDEILVRLDGMELFEPYHLQDFGGAISIIDLGLVRRVDLLMGGFPATYGDKMSGVFDITTKAGSREGFSVNLGIDLINAHALLEGPLLDKGSWLVSARRGYVDLILALIDADEDIKPQYADLYGKITYDLTEKDQLTLNTLYAWDDNFINEDDDEDDLDSTYQNAMIWTKWRHFYSEAIWSDLFIFNGLATRERREGIDGVDTRNFGFLGAKGELTARLLNAHTIRGGLEWRWSVAEYDYSVPRHQQVTTQFILNRCELCDFTHRISAEVDDRGWEVKGYLQDEWQLHPRLAINIGGRYLFQDYRRSEVQKYEFGPRVALAVKPIENLVLRGVWGLYHQPIDLMTIAVEDGTDDVGRAAKAAHYVVGAEYASDGNFMIRAEGYYKKLENLTGQIQDFGRGAQIIAPADSGDVKGFDLFMSSALSDRLTGSVGYAFSITKAREDNPRFNPPLFGKEFYRDFDQRHTTALNGSYRISPSLHLHVVWRFHTGNPTTHLEHTLIQASDGNLVCKRGFGEYNAERLPAYHSLDLRLTKTSEYKSWTLNWYVQILNLYNRSNVHERAFDIVRDEDTNALINCEVSNEPLFPILPTLGVSATF